MKRVSNKGFTLVELLVAIAILAIVAVLGWRGLDSIMRARIGLTAQMETTRGMQLAFAQLQSDCEHLVNPELLGTRPYLLPETNRLTLIRMVLTENEPTRLAVVSYRVQDGVLTRRESPATRELEQLDVLWQNAVGNADTTPAVVLQNGVTAMVMRVWEGSGWKVSTEAGQGTSPLIRTIPTGLEVALSAQGLESSMSKVFMLRDL